MAASGLYSVADILREVRRRGLSGRRGAQLSSTIPPQDGLPGPPSRGGLGIDVAGDFKAQAGIVGRRPNVAAYQRNHLGFPLRRFVRCGLCSRPLSGAWSKGKRARYAYYNCPSCHGVNVPQRQLEAHFVELLDRLRPRPEVLRLLTAAVLERWNDEQKGIAERRQAIEGRVEVLEQRKERIVGAYLYEGAIDKETYQAHLARVEEELTLA